MKRKVVAVSASQIKIWEQKISDVTKLLRSKSCFLNLGDASVSLLPSECIRAVSMLEVESAQRNLLLRCMADAEARSAGSSFVMLSMLSGESIDASASGKRFRIDDVHRSLLFFTGKIASDIVIDSVKIAGRKGKILLDKNISATSEIVFGSQICKWKPDQAFFASINSSKISISDCRVIFIDGIIESVSECHHLFQASHDDKIPLVVFSRGFADEVISTAAINFQRQTAQLIPIVISFDEVGVNALGDLASCFGSEVISSDKGQLVSSIKIEDCRSASRVTVTSDFTEIEFSDSRVDIIMKSITEKLKYCNEFEADILRKRIDALGSGSVTIRIGADQKSKTGILNDRIDFGIRFVKSCMSNGLSSFNDVKVPALSVKVGIESARSFTEMLKSCGCLVEVDRHVG